MLDALWLAVVAYLMVINGFSLALFALDKRRAAHRQRRIPEKSLLFTALIGGTVGAYWGRKLFRHKTRKQPFSMRLHMIATLQALAVAGGIWLFLASKYS